ncbi:MAG: hypothetical protein L3J95_04345 [Thermoplasmata archaeon]|nr:hypothetical protein [Thermoplasmata archaeon]MCI4359636.1 hypothetical protein [Thermoplasmata archaeon]
MATHEVVSATFPREVTERDELGMAIGKAIDTALSRYSHEASRGRRPGVTAIVALGRAEFEELARDADLAIAAADRAEVERQISGVVRAFRSSVLFGLERPRSRLILIGETVGVYAQPDFWDRRSTFYEMKSYRAIPPSPAVALQVALFCLAFPGFRARLVGLDRHANPVSVLDDELPPPVEEERARILHLAFDFGLHHGTDKVLEFIDVPVVRYPLPPGSDPTIEAGSSLPPPSGALDGKSP